MINRLKFSVNINAEKSLIWKVLWDEHSYRKWASVFYPGSYVVTNDWQEGTKVHFLAPDQSGIYSIIEKHVPNHIIRFKHIGKVVDGKEQPIDEETSKWSGASEIYSLTEEKGTKILKVDIDVMNEHLEFMKNKFPLALQKIKIDCS